MDRIYIFDVDGTLTPSRLPMTKEFEKADREAAKEKIKQELKNLKNVR